MPSLSATAAGLRVGPGRELGDGGHGGPSAHLIGGAGAFSALRALALQRIWATTALAAQYKSPPYSRKHSHNKAKINNPKKTHRHRPKNRAKIWTPKSKILQSGQAPEWNSSNSSR